MTDALIIADIHLSQDRPSTVDLFLHFLKRRAARSASLYILGDLFDAWIGDDDHSHLATEITLAFQRLTSKGTAVFIMRGNRDFLIGETFAAATGCTLLDDPAVVTLCDTPTLLMHGDLLCSDDLEYQQARKLLRSTAFIEDFLSKSLRERVVLAAEYRKRSGEVVSLKPADIMDVNQQTVKTYMRNNRVTRLIHGHTHRSAIHEFNLDGHPATRIVLSEWHAKRGSYLSTGPDGLTSHDFIIEADYD